MRIIPNFDLGHLLNLKASEKSENFNLQLLILDTYSSTNFKSYLEVVLYFKSLLTSKPVLKTWPIFILIFIIYLKLLLKIFATPIGDSWKKF